MRRRAEITLGLLAAAGAFALPAAPARAPTVPVRGVPAGMYNVNNQVMNSASYAYALRFVLDRDTTVARFISGFNLEGTAYLDAQYRRGRASQSRSGYSGGTGGVIEARLVRVHRDGRPDLRRVLAQETVRAVRRYREAHAAFGIEGDRPLGLLYVDFGGVRLRARVPYAVVYTNAARAPGRNWFSLNSPTVKASEAGPNGRNTTDPDARGAIAGLDPREAVAWSKDGGRSWVWGLRVGEGSTPGAYGGSPTSDDGVRLPWYGWQTAPEAPAESNQPYYAYRRSGNFVVRAVADSEQLLRRAGGYAAVGARIGRITVRNLATGATGRTRSLGSGLRTGALEPAVPVAAGQEYEIRHTGHVLKQEGDAFVQRVFGAVVTSGVRTLGAGADRAQLFAQP